MAFLFFAFFYGLIDVLGYRKWAFFFKVIGSNSLVVYYAYQFIDFEYSSRMFFGGLYKHAPEQWHTVFQSLGALGLVWLFLYFLYRNKIFVKI
jgi:predicted acyltransferase